MAWYEFVTQYEDRRGSSIVSGHRLSQPQSDSRRSSAQSNLSVSGAAMSKEAALISKRNQLQRTQTFDSAGTTTDDTLAVSSAHSTRSHSCIAPVDITIRRLSGNVNLTEEPNLDADGNPLNELDCLQSPPVVAPLSSESGSNRSSFAITRSEQKRREACWDLFQSEAVFLYDHLMVSHAHARSGTRRKNSIFSDH